MKYEVRCCCNPEKLVGWLEMPEYEMGPVYIQQQPQYHLRHDEDLLEIFTLEIATISVPQYPEIKTYKAIKDNHVPLEKLKQTPGFTPNEDCS